MNRLHIFDYLFLMQHDENFVEFLPVSRSLLWVDTLVDGVVKNEAVSAAKLYRVHPKLAVDVLPENAKVKPSCLNCDGYIDSTCMKWDGGRRGEQVAAHWDQLFHRRDTQSPQHWASPQTSRTSLQMKRTAPPLHRCPATERRGEIVRPKSVSELRFRELRERERSKC